MTQLFQNPDIFRIKVPLPNSPLKDLNVYLIRGEQRSLMVDTGFNRPECRAALREGMEELGLKRGTVDVFLTHLHADHIGLVWEIVNDGGTVYMGRAEDAYIRTQLNGPMWRAFEADYLAEGFPGEVADLQAQANDGRRYSPEPGFPVVPVEDGQILEPWGVQAVATPGHSPGHMCLYLPEEQILFSGDHILFDITPNITVWGNVSHSLERYMESLRKVKALPVRHTLPAHREGNGAPAARIDAILEHHVHRLNEVAAAVAAAPGSVAYEIAQNITWSMRGLPWEQFPAGQKWFAMGETMSHLHWLVDAGRMRRVQEGGLYRYYLPDTAE